MKRVRVVAVACVVGLSLAHSAFAGVTFYVNDTAGFNAAAVALTLAGTENFESSTQAPNQFQNLNDPLAPGVANPPFPTGTGTAAGVRVQSNTLAGSPSTTSPRGTIGLTTASVGFLGTPNDQISNQDPNDSFDMLFTPSNGQFVRAVGLHPLFFDNNATTATSNPGTLEIRVYNTSNVLLGTQTMTNVDYSGTAFLGVVATGTDVIGRINIWDLSTTVFFSGADDVSVYTAVTAPAELVSFSAE
jgi:hypothetical protein